MGMTVDEFGVYRHTGKDSMPETKGDLRRGFTRKPFRQVPEDSFAYPVGMEPEPLDPRYETNSGNVERDPLMRDGDHFKY